MMQELMPLMSKRWSHNYTCNHFASDVWQALKMGAIKSAQTKLDKPESPCIVYLSNSEKQDSHIGIFIDGKVLHLGLREVQYIDLDLFKIAFRNVSFYK